MPEAASRRVIPLIPARGAGAPGARQIEFRKPPPLALYVHIPWCVQKCPYCDFNSHALPRVPSGDGSPVIPEDDYLQALIADLEAALPTVWGRR